MQNNGNAVRYLIASTQCISVTSGYTSVR